MSDSQPPTHGSTMNRAQLDQLKQLEAFKPGVRAQLVSLFEGNARKQLAELRDAASRGDVDAARRSAHSLKGVSASLGASGLSALAAELETRCTRRDSDALEGVEGIGAAIDGALEALGRWLQET